MRRGIGHALLILAFAAAFVIRAAAQEKPAWKLLFEDKLAKTEGITRCPDGRLFVSENGAGNVWRLVDDENAELVADGLSALAGLACGPDNSLYVLEYGAGNVVKISWTEKEKKIEKNIEKFATGLKTPNGAVVAKDGTIYVSETNPGRVDRISPDGKVEKLVDGITFANGLELSADESTLYVASTTTGRILSVALTGEDAGKKTTIRKGLQMIDGIQRDGDGFIACLFASGQVVRIAADGAVTVLAKGITSPSSPARVGDSLYVTSLNGKGVYKIPLAIESADGK